MGPGRSEGCAANHRKFLSVTLFYFIYENQYKYRENRQTEDGECSQQMLAHFALLVNKIKSNKEKNFRLFAAQPSLRPGVPERSRTSDARFRKTCTKNHCLPCSNIEKPM